MSGHCPQCGNYHEEDDDRVCSRCASSSEPTQAPQPQRPLIEHYEMELEPMNVLGPSTFSPDGMKEARAAKAEGREVKTAVIAAAPDLLAACKGALALLEVNHQGWCIRADGPEFVALRKAIAKAEGRGA